MSLCVEEIGESIIVQHYVEDIAAKKHCRNVPVSDRNGREYPRLTLSTFGANQE
jgi:hypothetical protein